MNSVTMLALVVTVLPCVFVAFLCCRGMRMRKAQKHDSRTRDSALSSDIMKQLPINNYYTEIDDVFARLRRHLRTRGLKRNTRVEYYGDYE